MATGNCHFVVGTAPTATASNAYMAANQRPEYIKVEPGQKLAVIQDGTSTGTVYVTELSK